jgi:hypothetical protein
MPPVRTEQIIENGLVARYIYLYHKAISPPGLTEKRIHSVLIKHFILHFNKLILFFVPLFHDASWRMARCTDGCIWIVIIRKSEFEREGRASPFRRIFQNYRFDIKHTKKKHSQHLEEAHLEEFQKKFDANFIVENLRELERLTKGMWPKISPTTTTKFLY